jgi:hypothetical protein
MFDDGNCHTSKAVSGHMHMYFSHVLYILYYITCKGVLPSWARGAGEGGVGVGGGGGTMLSKVALLCGCVFLGLSILSAWWALKDTYLLGFHTKRHLLYGASTAFFTLVVLDGATELVERICGYRPLSTRRPTARDHAH